MLSTLYNFGFKFIYYGYNLIIYSWKLLLLVGRDVEGQLRCESVRLFEKWSCCSWPRTIKILA